MVNIFFDRRVKWLSNQIIKKILLKNVHKFIEKITSKKCNIMFSQVYVKFLLIIKKSTSVCLCVQKIRRNGVYLKVKNKAEKGPEASFLVVKT